MTERHVFISRGISREAFTATASRLTAQDNKLTYYVHEHPYGVPPCNDKCTVVRMGKVDNVTQLDDANSSTTR